MNKRDAVLTLLALCALIAPSHAGAQDWPVRCMSDPRGFAQEVNLNAAAAQQLFRIKRELDYSEDQARMLGARGLADRALEAQTRAHQVRQQMQQSCAQIGATVQAKQERRQLVAIEHELNRRVPGAADLVEEPGFQQWLEGRQGRTLRRDAWDQAIAEENFDRAAQMLRAYKRTRRSN